MRDADMASLPSEVRELASALTVTGFELAAEHGSGRVNRVLEFAGPGCRVRVSADRGQWWIELARPPRIDWFDPDVWVACLDDRPIDREPSSLAEQCAFVLQRWGEVAAAPPGLANCLARERSTRAHERLGLPPDVSG